MKAPSVQAVACLITLIISFVLLWHHFGFAQAAEEELGVEIACLSR